MSKYFNQARIIELKTIPNILNNTYFSLKVIPQLFSAVDNSSNFKVGAIES